MTPTERPPNMTTESTPARGYRRGLSPLVGASVASLLVVAALTGVAGVMDGSAGALGALAGSLATFVTFAWGTWFVNVVASVMPQASLSLALLTYCLQVLSIGVFAHVVTDNSGGGETLSHGWMAAGVVTIALVWMGAQVWATARLRTLAYDLPERSSGAAEPESRPNPEAGA